VTARAHEAFKRISKDTRASDDEKNEARKMWENVRKGDKKRHTQQRRQAEGLMQQAGLGDHRGPCGIEELQQMHEQLLGYKINVISTEIMFAYAYSEGVGKDLNILHHNNHYMVITTLPGFFESSYYCQICRKGYTRKRSHVGCGHRYVGRQGTTL
jgi:hypothetical protein